MTKDYALVDLGGGKTIELRYEFNALCDAEPATGVNLLAAQDRLMSGDEALTCNDLRALLFATICPYRGFPAEAREQLKVCGELFRPDARIAIIEGLTEAIALAISQEAAEKWRQQMLAQKEAAAAVPADVPPAEAPAPAVEAA